MGLSGEPEGLDSMLAGVAGPPPPPEPLPVLCWRMKKDKRDGVLGLREAGDSVPGLFSAAKKHNTKKVTF